MKKEDIQNLVAAELAKSDFFDNWHGITRANLKDHLVEPYLVTTISDPNGSDPSDTWIVLREYESESKGYLIGFCPSQQEWCLVEKLDDERYLCDTQGDKSLAAALSNM
jgi:hypothetical protein